MKLTYIFRISIITASLALVTTGCHSRSDTPKARVLKGRVLKIDSASGTVTGEFWIESRSEALNLTGKLAPDAEIMINGRTANLDDVRIDDEVTVTGWEEKGNNERRLIAKRVEIKRPITESQPTAASRPAEGS